MKYELSIKIFAQTNILSITLIILKVINLDLFIYWQLLGDHAFMSKKKDKKTKNVTDKAKKKFKQKTPDLVVAKEDDLREIVTETVTKLLAEDVLEMDDEGKIDLKKPKKDKEEDE